MKRFTVFLSLVYNDPGDDWYWIQVVARSPADAERKARTQYLRDLDAEMCYDCGDITVEMICEGWFAFRFGDASSPRLGARFLRQQKEKTRR